RRDPAPGLLVVRNTLGDGQAGDGDRVEPDLEDARGVLTADGQQVGARAGDGDVLVDEQLAAGQPNGVTVEVGGELEGVAVLGQGDLTPEGAGARVEEARDGQDAEERAILEGFQSEGRRVGPAGSEGGPSPGGVSQRTRRERPGEPTAKPGRDSHE